MGGSRSLLRFLFVLGAVAAVALAAVPSVSAAAAPARLSPRVFSSSRGTFSVLSCGAAGNCSAAGYFVTVGGSNGWVAKQAGGTWATAEDAVHLAKWVNNVQQMSCPSAGNCTAAGSDYGTTGHGFFVLGEKAGVWGAPKALTGLGQTSALLAISCPSAGNCVVAGQASSGAGEEPFVLPEKAGVWGKVQVMAVNGVIDTLSCPSVGNCSAGGYYGNPQAFVVNEKSGVWGKVEQVPGFTKLNTVGPGTVLTISCWSAGNCTAGGNYRNSSGNEGFVVGEKAGVWGNAANVPGLTALNTHGSAYVTTISCVTGGNCAAGGTFATSSTVTQVFVANEKSGVWKTAIELPGFSTLNSAGYGSLNAISCGAAGSCTAGGSYQFVNGAGDPQLQPYLATEANSTWGTAEQVPGLTAISSGGPSGAVDSVSCRSVGNCTAGGNYYDSTGYGDPFVVSETAGTWGNAALVPGFT